MPENKEDVKTKNSVDEIGSLLDVPGRSTSEPLPSIPVAPANAAAPLAEPAKQGKKRGPYKKKNRVEAPPIPERDPGIDAQAQAQSSLPPEVVARLFNGAYENLLLVLLSEEAKFTDEEKLSLDVSLAEYMKAKGIKASPLFALLLSYGVITTAKISKPKPKERIRGLWIAFKEKFGRKNKKDYPTKPSIEEPK